MENNKELMVTGKLQMAKNRTSSGRIYARDIVRKEVKRMEFERIRQIQVTAENKADEIARRWIAELKEGK